VAFALWTGALGGAETHTRRLCKALRDRHDIDAAVLFLRTGEPLSAALDADGIPWTCASVGTAARSLLRPDGLTGSLRKLHPAVVITTEYGLELPALLRSGYRGPIVVVEHGGHLNNPVSIRWRRRIAYQLARRLYHERVTCEVCVSQYMYGVQQRVPHCSRLIVIPNGVDTEVFSPVADARPPDDGPLSIVTAGSLRPEKGFAVLIRAFAVLARESGAAKLTIIGDGPDREALQELAAAESVAPSVIFAGSTTTVADLLPRHHVACVPSTSRCVESFGLVAAEAQACGLPVVASRRGGLREVVKDGQTGMLVPPDRPEPLTDALRRYVQDRSLVRRHGEAAREWALTGLSLKETARKYAALLNEVIGGSAGSRGGPSPAS